ncbi:ABC transporter transmembrane domain-containing protein [Ketobacter sp.]|uniref:ABC transporter transmembrane domain-containing protein n=1 Tax=Ketobacter sp. TaxID=2083498 RepID=UPI000F2C51E2|nr:ABC transporter transmembrane domain-containing protein [Ketobacter sp.]RLT99227.1 MAG: ATP-binding cassette domain-containing protein [Ketobacter sp.]
MTAHRASPASLALSVLRPYRRQILYGLLALLVTSTAMLSIGQGIRLLIDQGIATASTTQLRLYVFLFVGIAVILAAGTFTRYYWVSWLGERVVADLRERVFNHLIDLHPGFFEHNRALEIQTRLTTDTTLIQSVVGSSLSMALRNLIMFLGGLIWLFITNAKLTAIVIVSVPLVVTPILLFGRRVRGLSKHSQDKVADVGSYVGEILGNIKTVQAYNHQNTDKANFKAFVDTAFKVAIQRNVQRGFLITSVIILVLSAVGLMLWVGGVDVINGNISGGELAAFVFYSVIVGSAVASISEVIGELQRAAGATQRLFELLQSDSEIVETDTASNQHQPPAYSRAVQGAIDIQDLCFSYPSRPDEPAIDHLSLQVRPGETLALVGPSGAGKSTLFDLLLRFYEFNAGTITLDGVDIRQLSLQALRSCFAIVTQNPSLFYGSILENIRYGNPNASLEQVEAVAKAAHAHEFISEFPDRYHTHLGDGGIGLSGGQKQRIAIARALLANSPILLLDEATSALDAHSEFLVQQALDVLMQGRTTLVIAHRLATVKNADRIAVLNHGQVEAIGSHGELMASSELYQRLASLQFKSELT